MAETVAAALWEVGAAWATEAAIFVASNAAYINAAAAFVASSAYGGYQKRKAAAQARDSFNASLEDRLVMTATAQGARSRVYGRVRNVDGIVFKAAHGTNSEYYTLVIALAGHEVAAIEQVYFDDTPVTLDGSGYVLTAPWYVASLASHSTTIGPGATSINLGSVPANGATMVWEHNEPLGISGGQQSSISTSGTTVNFAAGAPASGATVTWQTNTGESYARVRAYTGAPGQDLYTVLQPLVGSTVQASDKFAGIACLVVTLKYNTDAFPSGVPQVSAVMRGAKVTDWRTGTTAWSQNPAVIAHDWARYANGGGCAAGEVNQPAFTTAANACDVSTTFTTTTGAQTRPLYQCGIAIPLDGNPDEALSEIVESMAGQWGWAGGKLTLRAGAYRAPVATITEDWVTDVSEVNVVDTATADLVNIMRPTLADAAAGYVVSPVADVRAAAYISADGRELPRELTLGGVTKAVHAQHVCGVLLRENREGLTISLPCNLRAYALELFDVVTVVLPTFGWGAGKLFEVMGWEFSLSGGVQLTLRETSAAIYTPDASFSVLTTSPNTALPNPAVVEQIGFLTVTSNTVTLTDSSIVSRMAVAWPAVVAQAVRQSGRIEVQYTEATDTLPAGDWPAAPPVPGDATSTTIVGPRTGVAHLVRARAVSSLGVRGQWSQQAVHLVAGPRPAQVYRQGSAPSTGVQDGDTWQDTSTGRQYERVAGVWQAVVGTGSVGTSQVAPGAVHNFTVDTYSFGGLNVNGAAGLQNLRTLTVTPVVDCKIVFDADIVVARLQGDSGYSLYWRLAVGGGSPAGLITFYSSSLDATAGLFSGSSTFNATAGVALVFTLDASVYPGAPTPMVIYDSSARALEYKR